MRRSDRLFAIGLGRCLSTQGFARPHRIQEGDRTLIYYHGPVKSLEELVDRDVQGTQHGTWGLAGEHYAVDYLFPLEHQYSENIIQEAIQHEW